MYINEETVPEHEFEDRFTPLQRQKVKEAWKNGIAPPECIGECDIGCSWCMVTYCSACKWFEDGWPGKVE